MPLLEVPSFAVLFRIHYWDETVAATCALLQERVGTGDLWVVADETNGAVAVPQGLRKFAITVAEAQSIGLPAVPEGIVFWHNNDYGLYLFHQAHPQYDYYYIVEHDAVVTASLDVLTAKLAEAKADLAALPNKIPEDIEWDSMSTCTEIWPKDAVQPHLLCFCALSRDAIPVLFAARRDHAERLLKQQIREWPLAEGYVPTQLLHSGLSVRNLSDFLDTADYDWWPPTHLRRIAAIGAGKVVHPVLAGQRYIDSLLRYDHLIPVSWFTPGSTLRRKLADEPAAKTFPALARNMIERGQFDLLFSLEDMHDGPLPELQAIIGQAIEDIAGGSEAVPISVGATGFTSSYPSWAERGLREEEATYALRKVPDGYPAFHTDFEPNPWWMADFGSPCLIDQIRIYNRIDAEQQRANNLSIWTSTNARRWVHCLDWINDEPFGGVDGQPLAVEFKPPRPARYIRIELMGVTALHLDAVLIQGWGPFPRTEPRGWGN